MNQQLPPHRMRLRKPNTCQKNKTQVRHLRLWRCFWTVLTFTTEAFSRPMRGKAPGVHVLALFRHTSSNVMMNAGLVALFTSVKPFAQADEDVSHKKAKAPVTNRSLKQKKDQTLNMWRWDYRELHNWYKWVLSMSNEDYNLWLGLELKSTAVTKGLGVNFQNLTLYNHLYHI